MNTNVFVIINTSSDTNPSSYIDISNWRMTRKICIPLIDGLPSHKRAYKNIELGMPVIIFERNCLWDDKPIAIGKLSNIFKDSIDNFDFNKYNQTKPFIDIGKPYGNNGKKNIIDKKNISNIAEISNIIPYNIYNTIKAIESQEKTNGKMPIGWSSILQKWSNKNFIPHIYWYPINSENLYSQIKKIQDNLEYNDYKWTPMNTHMNTPMNTPMNTQIVSQRNIKNDKIYIKKSQLITNNSKVNKIGYGDGDGDEDSDSDGYEIEDKKNYQIQNMNIFNINSAFSIVWSDWIKFPYNTLYVVFFALKEAWFIETKKMTTENQNISFRYQFIEQCINNYDIRDIFSSGNENCIKNLLHNYANKVNKINSSYSDFSRVVIEKIEKYLYLLNNYVNNSIQDIYKDDIIIYNDLYECRIDENEWNLFCQYNKNFKNMYKSIEKLDTLRNITYNDWIKCNKKTVNNMKNMEKMFRNNISYHSPLVRHISYIKYDNPIEFDIENDISIIS